jgi:hypothetical protein
VQTGQYTTQDGVGDVENDEMHGTAYDDNNHIDDAHNDEHICGSTDEILFGDKYDEIGICDNEDLEVGVDPVELELKETLKYKLINVQSEWDEQCISRTYQGRLLGHIFGDL